MTIEFGSQPKDTGIQFLRVDEDGKEHTMFVAVHDKFPQMQDVHIEGRRYVEVSVEMFIQLVEAFGYKPVTPGEVPSE